MQILATSKFMQNFKQIEHIILFKNIDKAYDVPSPFRNKGDAMFHETLLRHSALG